MACPRARAHAHAPVTSMHAAGAAGRALRGAAAPQEGAAGIFLLQVLGQVQGAAREKENLGDSHHA